MMGPEFARGYQRSMGKRANENPPRAWAAAPGAAVRPETTSGGTIARRLLFREQIFERCAGQAMATT
jgi:hypothetical protein